MFRLFTSTIRISSQVATLNSTSRTVPFICSTFTQPKMWKSDHKSHQTGHNAREAENGNNQSKSQELNYVVVRGVPESWTESDVLSHFNKQNNQVNKVNLIKNKSGESTGKVLLTLESGQKLNKFIERWDNYALQTDQASQNLSVQQFIPPTRDESSQKSVEIKQVYIYNISKVSEKDDISKYAAEFGKVDKVNLPLAGENKNKGFAYVNFHEAKDAQKFIQANHENSSLGKHIK